MTKSDEQPGGAFGSGFGSAFGRTGAAGTSASEVLADPASEVVGGDLGDGVVGDRVVGDGVEVLDEEEFTTPWHFKLLILALVVYLAWRGYQIAAWGIQELF